MAKPVKHFGTWRIRWVDAHAVRHSETYLDHATALRKLREHEHKTEEIKLGRRIEVAVHKTVNELCDYWIENKVPQKRSGNDDKCIIRKHLRPRFGRLRLQDITVEHGDRYIVENAHLDPKTIANHLTLFLSMLNRARDLRWIESVPPIKKPKVRFISQDYRWLRTDDEIKRLLLAAKEEGEAVYIFYAAAIYTGMRAGEIAALRWDDISFETRLITVQRSFDGPTKSADVRYVPILDPLLPILRTWKIRHPGTLVFTSEAGTMYQPSSQIFQEILHRVLNAAELKPVQFKKRMAPYITFHGFRHSFASHWVMNGGDIFKLKEILGHKSIQMTMRYSHLQPKKFIEDYDRLGTEAPGQTAAEVVDLKKASG